MLGPHYLDRSHDDSSIDFTEAVDVQFYEYVVLGCGGLGSSAVYSLAKKVGKGVLGLEQYQLGHDRGGSNDYSRNVRCTYPDVKYVKLAQAAFRGWEELEEESGLSLFFKTGMLDMADKGSPAEQLLRDASVALDQCRVNHELISGREVRKRFPQLRVSRESVALYEPGAGIVDAALANAAYIQLARAHGATIIDKCRVQKIVPTEDGGVQVHTAQGIFQSRRLVVTAGPWTNHVLECLDVHFPLAIYQLQVNYFATPNIKKFTKENFPVWRYGDEYSCVQGDKIYVMPIHGNSGVKVCHEEGRVVTIETRAYLPDRADVEACVKTLRKRVPDAVGPHMMSKLCLYTATPDKDFVLDTLAYKGYPQIIVCVGAGHSYKFLPVLGKIMSEMAIEGKSRYDITAFKADRPTFLRLADAFL